MISIEPASYGWQADFDPQYQRPFMRYVYLIRSLKRPDKRYCGSTRNLRQRRSDHNEGRNAFTSRFRPWALVVSVQFEDDTRAVAFERYLKSGSGHAFANRHLW